jgi:hypothetical protein
MKTAAAPARLQLATSRRALGTDFDDAAIVRVQANAASGPITIQASAPGLADATLVIETRKP